MAREANREVERLEAETTRSHVPRTTRAQERGGGGIRRETEKREGRSAGKKIRSLIRTECKGEEGAQVLRSGAKIGGRTPGLGRGNRVSGGTETH